MKRVLVVGSGSIGRRHLANLRALLPGATIVVWRHRDDGSGVPAGADRAVFSLADALASRPELAVLCTPAPFHRAAGVALAAAGAHLLVEKPIATTLDDAGALVEACERAGRTLAVGYNLRFTTSLAALRERVAAHDLGRVVAVQAAAGQYLPDWRPGTDYRAGPSARAELGGGALLELSHELDYASWLAGAVDEVAAVLTRRGDLELDVEDTAELLLRFASGAVGSIHLDLLARAPLRRCRVVGTAATASWDGIAGTLTLERPGGGAEVVASDGNDRNASYVAELRDVLDAIATGRPPRVGGADGVRALELVLAARAAHEGGRMIALRALPA